MRIVEIRGAIEIWIKFEINYAINGLEENADVNDIDSMTGMQYEHFCKSILVKAGWEVEDTPSGDQGVDLIASLDDMRACISATAQEESRKSAVQEVAAGLQHYKGTTLWSAMPDSPKLPNAWPSPHR